MCIGPMSLVQTAASRDIAWDARGMGNGGLKRMRCASIEARMTEAVTRCGCLGRMWNSEGRACRLHPKEFCSRQRPVIDLSGLTRVCPMKTKAKTIQILVFGCALFATVRHARGGTIQKDFWTTNSGA